MGDNIKLNIVFTEFFRESSKQMMVYPAAFINQREVEPLLSFKDIQVVNHDDVETETSYLNTPIFFPVVFQGGQYNVYRDGKIEKVQVDDFRLPLATLVNFRRVKRSTETPVSSGEGSVTETYSIENWSIEFQGLCMDEPNHPHGADTFLKQEKRLLEFDGLVDAIKVSGDLFTRKGIFSLKINEIVFMQNKGRPRITGFQMNCSSVTPIELIIKDNA